jgi:hypothetical protein
MHKIGCIYCTILNLPPKVPFLIAKLLFGASYNSDDVKTYGYDPILQPLVEDIKDLENEGLTVT